MRKKFDRKLYEENDKKAKNKATNLLRARGFSAQENSRKTGVDLLVYKNNEYVFNVEVEIKKKNGKMGSFLMMM